MTGLHRFSTRHPRAVLLIAILATAVAAPGMSKLRLRTDGHALVPQHAPEVVLDRAVRREFGVRDPLVVVVRPRDPDGIYNPRTLRLIADLSGTLARIPGLDSAAVRSLATETSDHFRTGSLSYRRLLEPLPQTRQRLDELRGDIEAFGVYKGAFASFDGRSAAILVGAPPQADRTALVADVQDVIARADTAGHELHVIGAPVAETLLGSHILEDLGVPWRWLGRRPERFAELSESELDVLSRLRLEIARHLGLLPLSVVIMAIVFLMCFRSVTATLLPLAEAGACLVFVFGLMGWTGVPVYLTMAVLPVILVSMGLVDEIHVFYRYAQHRAAHPDAPIGSVVDAAFDEMSLPVIATALVTATGFLSFAISPLEPVRAFGLFTAAGLLFCMLWSLTAIPAMLVLLAPRGFGAAARHHGGAHHARGFGWWPRVAGSVARRPIPTLAFAVLGIALCPLGIRRLEIQDSWISGFARESAFYRATQSFNREFFGAHRLLVALDTGQLDRRGPLAAADMTLHDYRLPAGIVADPATLVGCSFVISRRVAAGSGTSWATVPIALQPTNWSSVVDSAMADGGRIRVTTPLEHGSALFLLAPAPGETLEYQLRSRRLALPDVLQRVDELERFARSQSRYTVGGVLGPADQITTAEYVTNDRAAGSREIPRDPERTLWLWNSIGVAQGPERLREVIDPTFRRGLVTVFLKNANFKDTGRLMNALRDYGRARLAPLRIRMDFAGDVAVSQALIQAIVDSQVRSLLGSVLGILAVTTLVFRSLRWGIVCSVPAALSVAATFAVMGWLGMPLGVATSMFAGMVLGVGVDFSIHLVERFRLSVARGANREAAIVESLTDTGPAIVINALAVALGFGILAMSRVPANAQLGILTAVSLVTCLVATLLVIPALLRLSPQREPQTARSQAGDRGPSADVS